jgi:hypothetical protein
MVDLIAVDSSMIAAVGYDPEARSLVVLFNSGKTYEYHEVPPEEYQGLMEADSKGQYMNSRIIRVYPDSPFRGWNKRSTQE